MILTKGRRELRIAIKSSTYKHDGIVRPLDLLTRSDLGFIEMKPGRHYVDASGSTADRTKVLESMAGTLRMLDVPGVIVAGILCNGMFSKIPSPRFFIDTAPGMAITIIRGTLLGDICLFKETTLGLSLEKLPLMIECCWKLKLALEELYRRILDSIPEPVFT